MQLLNNKNKELQQAISKAIATNLVNLKDPTALKISWMDILKNLKDKPIQPTIKITQTAYNKMLALVNNSDIEISWHGFVERDLKTNTYTINDIIVFPQINSAVSTTTDDAEYAEWLTKLLTDPNSNFEKMRMHGHSHVHMNVYSSGVDDKYQQDLATQIKDGDYYIFLVLNKRKEIFPLLYDYYTGLIYSDKEINIEIEGNNENEWAKKQIKEFCKKPTYKAPANKETKSYVGYDIYGSLGKNYGRKNWRNGLK